MYCSASPALHSVADASVQSQAGVVRASFVYVHPSADEAGRLPILTFFNYILKKVTLYQTRVELGVNNTTGDGYACVRVRASVFLFLACATAVWGYFCVSMSERTHAE